MAIPSLAAVKQFSTTGKGLEGIRQSLYDHLLYPTAGQNQFNFFALPKGQGVTSALGAVVGSPKTIADTNLDVASTLPSGKAFLLTSIEVPFYAGASAAANTYTPANPAIFAAVAAAALALQAADVKNFYLAGSLQLFISSKVVLEEAPLLRFPPKTYHDLDGAITSNSATTSAIGTVGSHAAGRPYMLEPPVYLEPNVNFNVALNYPGAVATPSGFNARVQVILDGYLYRLA
jgi:hypothetical protein